MRYLVFTAIASIVMFCLGAIGISVLYIGGKGGFVGLDGAGGFGITPNIRRTLNVLKAAPFNCSVCFEMEQPTQRKKPPAYVTVDAFMLQGRSQETPSSCCTVPPKSLPDSSITHSNPDNSGSARGFVTPFRNPPWAACTRVDVWLPEESSNALETPAANDSNATVSLDITPPLEGNQGDCSLFVHSYGKPPAKPGNV